MFHFIEGKPFDYQELLAEQPAGSAGLRRAHGLGDEAEAMAVPFVNIGLNRPLTVELRHVYLGNLLPEGRRRRSKSLLVTTAMRSVAQYNAEPRAINFLSQEIGEQRDFQPFDATRPGTPIVYYSPALTRAASMLTIELGFDDFDRDLFDQLGDLLKSAGGLPVFMAWGGYLMAAGRVVKLASRILERFKERRPVFKAHESINFVSPGGLVPMAGFSVLGGNDVRSLVREGYTPDPQGVLIDRDGNPYSGRIPYVTISLDGAERPDLRNFEATQASASILSDFFAIQEDQSADLTLIMDSLRLLNDLKFRREADEIRDDIVRIGDDPDIQEKKSGLEEKLEAVIKNISQKELRP